MMPPTADELAPFVPWQAFKNHFRFVQGEHVGLIGPTGSGKSTLLLVLLDMRKYVVVFGTKPEDKTLDKFIKAKGYKRIAKWSNDSPRESPRRILWPPSRDLYSVDRQRVVFKDALAKIYVSGGWCVCFDELWYAIHQLGLQKEIKTYLQQSRSINISLVLASQRPAFIPLEVYDQSTHLFFWRDNDETNLKRISGISYLSANAIRSLVANLRRYEVLYINTKTGQMLRTHPPLTETSHIRKVK